MCWSPPPTTSFATQWRPGAGRWAGRPRGEKREDSAHRALPSAVQRCTCGHPAPSRLYCQTHSQFCPVKKNKGKKRGRRRLSCLFLPIYRLNGRVLHNPPGRPMADPRARTWRVARPSTAVDVSEGQTVREGGGGIASCRAQMAAARPDKIIASLPVLTADPGRIPQTI